MNLAGTTITTGRDVLLLALGGTGPFTFGLDAEGRNFDQFWIRWHFW